MKKKAVTKVSEAMPTEVVPLLQEILRELIDLNRGVSELMNGTHLNGLEDLVERVADGLVDLGPAAPRRSSAKGKSGRDT